MGFPQMASLVSKHAIVCKPDAASMAVDSALAEAQAIPSSRPSAIRFYDELLKKKPWATVSVVLPRTVTKTSVSSIGVRFKHRDQHQCPAVGNEDQGPSLLDDYRNAQYSVPSSHRKQSFIACSGNQIAYRSAIQHPIHVQLPWELRHRYDGATYMSDPRSQRKTCTCLMMQPGLCDR